MKFFKFDFMTLFIKIISIADFLLLTSLNAAMFQRTRDTRTIR